jgi:hypothetical protein
MTALQQKRIIRAFYRLNRPVTDAELEAEIANLERRRDAGTLCNLSGDLAARLHVI